MSSQEDLINTAAKFKALKRIVVSIIGMGFCRDHTLLLRIQHHDIRVASGKKRPFTGIHSIELRSILAEETAHPFRCDLSGFHSIGVKKGSSCLHSRK